MASLLESGFYRSCEGPVSVRETGLEVQLSGARNQSDEDKAMAVVRAVQEANARGEKYNLSLSWRLAPEGRFDARGEWRPPAKRAFGERVRVPGFLDGCKKLSVIGSVSYGASDKLETAFLTDELLERIELGDRQATKVRLRKIACVTGCNRCEACLAQLQTGKFGQLAMEAAYAHAMGIPIAMVTLTVDERLFGRMPLARFKHEVRIYRDSLRRGIRRRYGNHVRLAVAYEAQGAKTGKDPGRPHAHLLCMGVDFRKPPFLVTDWYRSKTDRGVISFNSDLRKGARYWKYGLVNVMQCVDPNKAERFGAYISKYAGKCPTTDEYLARKEDHEEWFSRHRHRLTLMRGPRAGYPFMEYWIPNNEENLKKHLFKDIFPFPLTREGAKDAGSLLRLESGFYGSVIKPDPFDGALRRLAMADEVFVASKLRLGRPGPEGLPIDLDIVSEQMMDVLSS